MRLLLSPNLLKFSNAGNANPPRNERGKTQGWTDRAVRSNRDFLGSVPIDSLQDGNPAYSFTLTLKDCPDTAADFHELRRSVIKRLERKGMYRYHWVMEWQARGVSHLHGCYWLNDYTYTPRHLIDAWCQIAKQYGPAPWAQHIAPITNALGWLKYLAKHAARGKDNYQRHNTNAPAGWRESTGRVWGKGGDWIQIEPIPIENLKKRSIWALRRSQRRLAESQARRSQNWKWLVAARNSLKHPDKGISQVKGITTWLPLEHSLVLVDYYADRDGYLPVETQDSFLPSVDDPSDSLIAG